MILSKFLLYALKSDSNNKNEEKKLSTKMMMINKQAEKKVKPKNNICLKNHKKFDWITDRDAKMRREEQREREKKSRCVAAAHFSPIRVAIACTHHQMCDPVRRRDACVSAHDRSPQPALHRTKCEWIWPAWHTVLGRRRRRRRQKEMDT